MYSQNLEMAISQLRPFLTQYLSDQGIDPSKKFCCLNPSHDDKTPSMSIIGAGTEHPRAHCFSCDATYDLFDVVKIIEKKPAAGIEWINDTIKYLGDKYGVEIKTRELTENEVYELNTFRAYRAAADLIKSIDIPKEENPLFWKELNKRGWTPEGLADEGVGTVKSFDDFYEALISQGFTRKFLSEIDLNRKDIFNPDNMIFTWKDEKGRPVGFTARNLKYEAEKETAEKNGEKYNGKKYNNQRTTGLKVNIFNKGKRFYGIDRAIKAGGPLYIFEGQADVVTAHINGLLNAVAIAGSSLHEDHIQLLRQLGIFDICLALDADDTGQKKMAEILEKKFAGKRDMRVKVLILPAPEDPDSFIRKKGIAAFKSLAHWTAFEWRLNRYPEEADETEICKQMVPFIVNESSPVVRDKLCKLLAKRTGVTLKAVTDELDLLLDAKANQRSKERQNVIENTIYELKTNPGQAELTFQKAQTDLLDLSRKHDTDTLSNENFVRALDEQKSNEEKLDTKDSGLNLGLDLRELQEVLRGDWEGCFICIGGRENSGKSAWVSKIAYEIASNNNDVCVIYHTIDDTSEQLVPRFVTIAEGSRKLSINMVRQPKYWRDIARVPAVNEMREDGYKKVRELASQGKLVVKDISHGNSVAFIENLILYYKSKFPGRKIIYVLDNFHKLRDYEGTKDERIRFKALSEAMKGLAIRHYCTVIATVEYTKMPPGTRPTSHSVAETVQIAYDANAIIHLYSDKTENPSSFTICHRSKNWKGEQVDLPRVEFIVSKNKISEQKESFFMDFFPASSDYKYVDQGTVLKDAQKMKEDRCQEITEKDPDDMTVDELNNFFNYKYGNKKKEK